MTGVTVDMVVQAGLQQISASRANAVEPERADLKGITVFLDRDGTVNRDTGFVKTPEELELLPGVAEAVLRLKRAGARVIVVTNQSGLARGLITPAALEAIHAKLRSLLTESGTSLDAIYFCPHHPDEGCACRKPKTGMVQRAAAQLGLDPGGYYVIGDQRRDIELGHRIGARTILVTTGPMSGEHLAALRTDGCPPDCAVASLGEAVEWIVENCRSRQQSTVSRQLSLTTGLED